MRVLAIFFVLVVTKFASDRLPAFPVLAEESLFDSLMAFRTQALDHPGDPVVIISVDREDLKALEIGSQELTPHLNRALSILDSTGAKVVGFDFLTSSSAGSSEGDVLVETLSRLRQLVVVGSEIDTKATPASPPGKVAGTRVGQRLIDRAFVNFDFRTPEALARNRGSTRRVATLVYRSDGSEKISFAARIAQKYLDLERTQLTFTDTQAQFGTRKIELEQGFLRIPILMEDAFTKISLHDLLETGEQSVARSNALKGKIVLIGSYLAGARDRFATSDRSRPGVEIQAAIVRALIGRDAIRPCSSAQSYFLILFATILGSLGLYLRTRFQQFFYAGTVSILIWAMTLALLVNEIWLPSLFALLAPMLFAVFPVHTPTPIPISAETGQRDTSIFSRYPSMSDMAPALQDTVGTEDLTFQLATRVLDPRYRDPKFLGQGGMGLVLTAHDTDRDETVAIKVLSPMLRDRQVLVRRFIREVAALEALDHPGVVKVHDIFTEGDIPYYVMELISGRNLKEMQQDGDLKSPEETFEIFDQILDAVSHIHDHGVIHRDIKPENIMVTNDFKIKLLDFGLAHVQEASTLTQHGQIMGTLRYMSPEQRDGSNLTPASDVFSLALIIYEHLAGELPFPIVAQLPNFQVPYRGFSADLIKIPAGVEELLGSCLVMEASERLQSAAQLRANWRSCYGRETGV